MRIKLKSPLIVVILIVLVNFSLAKNAQKRRPAHIEAAHETEGHYLDDQIASETIQYTSSSNVVVPPPHGVPEQHFRDHKYDDQKYLSKTPSKNGQSSSHDRHRVHEKKPDYLAPMKNSNSPHEYVESALKIRNNFVQRESHVPTNEEVPASSFFEYTTVNYDEPKKISSKPKKNIYQDAEEGVNYHLIKKPKPTQNYPQNSTPKASMKKVKLTGERHYYQPESADAEIYKETTDGDGVSNYHYYYPPVMDTVEAVKPKPEFHIKKKQQNVEIITTEAPKFVYKQYPVYHQPQQTVQSSTDQYQYQPVLQRPEHYDNLVADEQAVETKPLEYYYPPLTHQNSHNVAIKSTGMPQIPSLNKMRAPTKKPETHETRYFSPSPSPQSPSAMPSPTAPADHSANIKIKYMQPTKKPFNHQNFYASPSPSLQFNTDSTNYNKYSTPSSTTVHASIQFSKPSGKPPISSTLSPEMDSDSSNPHTVIIQPKPQYQRPAMQQPKKEQPKHIVYAFSEPGQKTDSFNFSRQAQPTHPTFFNSLHAPTYHDNHNSTQPIMKYNYKTEFFTEQDANHGDAMHGEIMKVNPKVVVESQKAEKKNEFYQNDFFQNQNLPYMRALEEREMPPPRNQHHNLNMNMEDQQQEASKNHHQYVVLYQLDQEQKKEEKKKEQHVQHHHHHEHEFQNVPDQHNNYYYETTHSEQGSPHSSHDLDSEILGSDSFRIFDNKKGARPYEITKDDYMRHIKQAALQYMKEMNGPDKDMQQTAEANSPKNYYAEITNQQNRYNRLKNSDSEDGSYRKKPSEPIKITATLKLPKNTFQAGQQLTDAIDNLREANSNVDLTFKKAKSSKPFDMSAIDVGQSYQHISFDHPAAMKNTEEFDQSNVVNHAPQKPRLHFNQQTYYDINAMTHNNPNNKNRDREQEASDPEAVKLFKGYVLPETYGTSNKGKANHPTSINYGNKLPRIVHQDDEDDENGRPDAIDTPIQIINGIPVANPYNIDMNTLKYMLGGVAQAQVNDQLKDFDETPSKPSPNWKPYNNNKHFSDDSQNYPSFGNPVASGTSNSETFASFFNNNNNSQRKKKNTAGQTGNLMNQPQKSQFPLLNQLVNNVRSTRNNNQDNGPSMSFNNFMKAQLNSQNNRNNENNSPSYQNHRNNEISNNNHRNNEFTPQNNNKKLPNSHGSSNHKHRNVFGNNNPNVNFGFQDMNYGSWDQSKKRYEPQASSYHPQIAQTNGQRVLIKPVNKKHSRIEKLNNLGGNKSFKQPDRELRPPPKLHNIN